MKSILLITLSLIAGLSLAETLSGTYEFPPPEGLEGDSAIVKLDKDEEGNYLAQVTVAEETIKGTNVVVGENQFSFDIEVKTQEGDMSQAYKVQLDDGEVSLSILSELGGRSESMTFAGKLINEIVGTYKFLPQEGLQNDTTTIQLAKDDEDNFSVKVTVFDKTIEGTNIRVSEDHFSFDTEVKNQNGNKFQSWKVKIEDDEVKLTVLAEVGGQSQSITLKGSLETDERSPEN
ncbi:MAG: hypothetical protein F4Z01_03975 [Gammaproteobacteria bacterium]|nr:hypothetical protein [Gammaproteobacteria bacterium]